MSVIHLGMEGFMGKRIKAVKSFTVDGAHYDALAKMFKESDSVVSLSTFVNHCLKELSIVLSDIAKVKKEVGFEVPMAYIIKSLVERNDLFGFYGGIPSEHGDVEYIEHMLDLWEYEYGQREGNIPVEFHSYLKKNTHMLSPNRRYLIDKKTGEKVIPVSDHKVVPLNETGSKGRKAK
jgi:hypothetical protein